MRSWLFDLKVCTDTDFSRPLHKSCKCAGSSGFLFAGARDMPDCNGDVPAKSDSVSTEHQLHCPKVEIS